MMERIFFLDITEELKVRLGFAVWLKRLAERCDFQIHFSPSVIRITKGMRTIISAGVPAAYPSFVTLVVDQIILVKNRDLVDYIETLKLAGAWEEDREFIFIFNPVIDPNKNILINAYQHHWQDAIAYFLNCNVVPSNDDENFQFELQRQKQDGELVVVGYLGRGNIRIVIDSFIPFVVDGIAGYLLQEANRLDRRFRNFFLPEKKTVSANDGYEYNKED